MGVEAGARAPADAPAGGRDLRFGPTDQKNMIQDQKKEKATLPGQAGRKERNSQATRAGGHKRELSEAMRA